MIEAFSSARFDGALSVKAMMLTAGLGTRLRPVTDLYAKPAVPFLNIPLFYYPLSLIEELPVSTLVLNTHYKPEQIENLASRIPEAKFKIALSPEPAAPLGSGGGIWRARALLEGEGSFLVSNGDEVILPRDPQIMRRFQKEHEDSMALATILVMRHPLVGKQFGGVWTDAHGFVRGFGKDPAAFPGCTGYHYVGLLLLHERVFSYLPDGESNILYDALTAAIASGERVRATVGDFTWYETGNPRDFLQASGEALRLLAENDSSPEAQTLKRITTRFLPKRTSLERRESALVLRGPGSTIEPRSTINGFAVLGAQSSIESADLYENVVVLPSAIARGGARDIIVLPEEEE